MTEQTAVMPSEQVLERCTGCGKPMAGDQRYCLNCGKRRGKPRVEFEEYLPEAGGDGSGPPEPPAQGQVRPVPPEEPDLRPEREVTPLMAAVGLAGVAAILLIGVLIGRSGGGHEGSSQQPIIASTGLPTSTTTNSTSTTTASVTVTPDWPAGTEGFTIELATLSKDGADGAAVEAAKTDLMSQGATEVGVIDSDEYGSLPGGNYVLYSGVYTSKAEAETALAGLQANFPDAQVIEVAAEASSAGGAEKTANEGGGADDGSLTDGSAANSNKAVQASEEDLQDLAEATGEEYEEIQKKLPPTISTPGEAPPKDNKAPGGGGGAVTIG